MNEIEELQGYLNDPDVDAETKGMARARLQSLQTHTEDPTAEMGEAERAQQVFNQERIRATGAAERERQIELDLLKKEDEEAYRAGPQRPAQFSVGGSMPAYSAGSPDMPKWQKRRAELGDPQAKMGETALRVGRRGTGALLGTILGFPFGPAVGGAVGGGVDAAIQDIDDPEAMKTSVPVGAASGALLGKILGLPGERVRALRNDKEFKRRLSTAEGAGYGTSVKEGMKPKTGAPELGEDAVAQQANELAPDVLQGIGRVDRGIGPAAKAAEDAVHSQIIDPVNTAPLLKRYGQMIREMSFDDATPMARSPVAALRKEAEKFFDVQVVDDAAGVGDDAVVVPEDVWRRLGAADGLPKKLGPASEQPSFVGTPGGRVMSNKAGEALPETEVKQLGGRRDPQRIRDDGSGYIEAGEVGGAPPVDNVRTISEPQTGMVPYKATEQAGATYTPPRPAPGPGEPPVTEARGRFVVLRPRDISSRQLEQQIDLYQNSVNMESAGGLDRSVAASLSKELENIRPKTLADAVRTHRSEVESVRGIKQMAGIDPNKAIDYDAPREALGPQVKAIQNALMRMDSAKEIELNRALDALAKREPDLGPRIQQLRGTLAAEKLRVKSGSGKAPVGDRAWLSKLMLTRTQRDPIYRALDSVLGSPVGRAATVDRAGKAGEYVGETVGPEERQRLINWINGYGDR